jgi:hypothetical protein
VDRSPELCAVAVLSPARTAFHAAGIEISGLRYAGPTVAHPEQRTKNDINTNKDLARSLVDSAGMQCLPEMLMSRLRCFLSVSDSKLHRESVKTG